jgi:hypothetical protein
MRVARYPVFVSVLLMSLLSRPDGARGGASPEIGTIGVVFCIDTESDGFNYGRFSQSLDLSAFLPGNIVEQALDPHWRLSMLDSFGNHLRMSWYLMTIPAYRQTPQGPSGVIDAFLTRFERTSTAVGDEIAWHYHHAYWLASESRPSVGSWRLIETFDGTIYGAGVTDRCLAMDNLAVFVASSRVFPTSYRAGWNWENTHFSGWLDSLVPFDYSHFWAQVDPALDYYHPSSDNLYNSGDMRRMVVRCHPAPDSALVESAVAKAAGGQDVLLAVYTHNYGASRRHNNAIKDRAEELHRWMKRGEASHGVGFRYMTATEAARWRAGIPLSGDRLTARVAISDGVVLFSPDFELFGVPFVSCWHRSGNSHGYFMQPDASSDAWGFSLADVACDSILIGVASKDGRGYISRTLFAD